MKALLYKEFTLAMHPLCYVFIALFPLMILIPNYPLAIGFICVLNCYPIVFLGAKNGQQSNDLLYSVLMPVRKKDIVLARIILVLVMQAAFILLTTALYPLARIINAIMPDPKDVGLNLNGYVSLISIVIIGYALADLIFFPIYYKAGKSIVVSTLFTILGFVFFLLIFTLALPMIPGLSGYKTFLCDSGLGVQFGLLGGALALTAIIHFLVYKISSKELEQVDL